jgi:hypothetical protein
MADGEPSVPVRMKMLVAASRGLMRAEKRLAAAARVTCLRGVELVDARLVLKVALESLQAELPGVGELPPAIHSEDCGDARHG